MGRISDNCWVGEDDEQSWRWGFGGLDSILGIGHFIFFDVQCTIQNA